MALKKLSKDDEEFKIFQEVYKLYQEFFVTEESDEYWEEFIDKSSLLSKKYGDRKLIRGLVLAIGGDLEERYKNEKQNRNRNTQRTV